MDLKYLSAIFSDETALFRTPAEPEAGDTVKIRIRTAKGSVQRVKLYLHDDDAELNMFHKKGDGIFDYFETALLCDESQVAYSFLLDAGEERVIYQKNGARIASREEKPHRYHSFRFTPGFHVPKWSRGAVQYQIFVDRFRNGDPTNDVDSDEYYYVIGHSAHRSWNDVVDDQDIRCFYGGDLQGVWDKLDYLQGLGVEVIYFNPIFISPSSHKYDIQDYEHVDPHFTPIVDDDKHRMQLWERHNGYAKQYIRRVTSLKNLDESDRFFARFCEEVHKRGMRIILDGVFNHCGSFNKWMDREGIYVSRKEFAKGAFQDVKSPYRSYFKFGDHKDQFSYEGWWGFETLPKLNYEGSPELREAVMKIGEKWASPPYSIDGWRLDVAADLGHSAEYNHDFWREFRQRVKKANPEIVIIAEHYGDASSWLMGDQWDSVMNYDAFMEPVTFFLTGMEKHSDAFRGDLYQNGEAFFNIMRDKMSALLEPSLYCAMNELSNHDHSRFLTRTNRRVGRLHTAGSEAAGQGIDKSVLREAVAIQMTWPGSPTIYYGDEAGVVGWTDPDCRRTYPWGNEDNELIALHRDLIALRKKNPVLIDGSVTELKSGWGLISYARFDEKDCVITTVNNTENSRTETISVEKLGLANGTKFLCSFTCDEGGHHLFEHLSYIISDGAFSITLKPHSAVILTKV